jgi:urease beta subunit
MGGIGLEPVTQLVEMTFLGTGFGDRFKVLRGDSRRFEEGVRRAVELAELQGKRASKRCSLAVRKW